MGGATAAKSAGAATSIDPERFSSAPPVLDEGRDLDVIKVPGQYPVKSLDQEWSVVDWPVARGPWPVVRRGAAAPRM